MITANLRISSKFLLAIIALVLLTALATGLTAQFKFAADLEDSAKTKLVALRESRQAALEQYLNAIRQDLQLLASNNFVHSAMLGFTGAWEELGDEAEPTLQRLYIQESPNAAEERYQLADAGDGSRYSTQHSYYHPWFLSFLQERGYYDIFLFSPDGDLIYTVVKERDFATNFRTGPWSGSNLGKAFQAISAQPAAGQEVFRDFERYEPSRGAPASFIATPLFDREGEYLGVLAFQMPIDRINQVMRVSAGMGETGESYIVGQDRQMRTDSIFMEESTVLQAQVDTTTVRRALAGESGIEVIDGHRGMTVVSAFGPLSFLGVRWAVLAEIGYDELVAPVGEATRFMVLAVGAVLLTGALFAAVLSRGLSRPIVEMTGAMRRLAAGDLDVEVPATARRDEIGEMAKALEVFKENAEKRRVAEQSLHASEQRLLSILASSPIGAGIALAEPTNAKLMYVNERYSEMFGASMEDLLGGDARERFADQAQRMEAVERVDRDGSARDLEMRLRRPDGSEFWGLVSFFPIEYAGKPARIAWFYDITERKKAEEEIKRSREQFNAILEASPVGIAVTLREDGKTVYANARFAEQLRLGEDRNLGRDLKAFWVDPKDRDRVIGQAQRNGVVEDVEVRRRRCDGTEFWALMSALPVTFEGREAILSWTYDSTERKKSQDRFRALLESAPDATVIVNGGGKIIQINQQTEKLFGFTAKELLGEKVEILLPEHLREGHPAHRAQFYKDARVRPMGQDLELHGQAKDGHEFPIEISLSPIETEDGTLVSASVRDITERKLVEEDLQKRSRLIELLQQTAEASNKAANFDAALGECLTRICESIGWPVGHAYLRSPDGAEKVVPSGIWHLPDEDRFAVFKEITERTSFDSGVGMPGRVFASAQPEWIDDVMKHPEFLRAKEAHELGVHSAFAVPVIQGTQVVAILEFFTAEVLKPDETTQQTFQTIMQIGDQLGQVLRRVEAEAELRHSKEQAEAALTDLTRAQQQLVTTEKMASLGQLTAGIAHEIKNPLNFVNNFSETCVELLDELKEVLEPVQDQVDQDGRDDLDDIVDTLRGDLDKINHHGKRADSIVKSMLLHARGDSGTRVQTAVNTLVDEALSLAYHGERARDKSFQVTMDHQFDEAAGQANLVPQEITRVLVNLFSNAFYAVKKRDRQANASGYAPKITVWTEDKGRDVEIRVRDNGIGMSPEVREKLFDPFFTTKPTGEGTGLGLSMSFDIVVQQHGGRIDVDSEPGAFTEFVITLPRDFSNGQSAMPEVEVA